MTTTALMGFTHLEENAASPEIRVNALADNAEYTVHGYVAINFSSDANLTLSTSGNFPRQWQYGFINLTDTGVVLTTARNVIVPTNRKRTVFKNSTAQDLTVKTAAGTGITIAAGEVAQLQCDGTNVISADGGGGTDNDTTYSISAETATGGVNFRLTDSGAGTDDVKLAEGTGMTITRTDANTITFAASTAASVLDMPSQSKSADYTVLTSEQGNLFLVDDSGATRTITLPAAASATDGFTVAVKKMSASNTTVIDGNGAETIDGAATYTLSSQYDTVFLQCDGAGWNILTEPASGATDSNAVHVNSANEITGVTEKTTADNDDEILTEDSEASYVKKSMTISTLKKLEENAQTGTTYTLVLDDENKMVTMSNASSNTLTVPPNSSVAFPVGAQVVVSQEGAGQTTIAQGAGVTINNPSTLLLRAQYSKIALVKKATDEWDLIGDTE